MAYFFSFDTVSRPAAVESASGKAIATPLREVMLSWDAVPNANTYNLYWSTEPGVTRYTDNKIAGIAPPYRFARVENGHTYYFVVTAVSGAGESGESAEIVYRAGP